jgi:hypothetical protein
MKVIKKGFSQIGWTKQLTCTGSGNSGGGCGAILEISEDDLIVLYGHARDETTTYVSFVCCECGVITDVFNNEVPSKIIPYEIALRVIRKKEKENATSNN